MPAHEEHCAESMRKYGKRFDELHTWMDEPWEILGRKHRRYRHDPYTTPEEAKKLFGEYADHACLDHIRLDYPEYVKPQSEAGMDTDFCTHWQGDKTSKWCRQCEYGKREGQPCYDLWNLVRDLASKSLVLTNNRPGKAFGNRYRLEAPSPERCHLKMLQGKRTRLALPREDFLYVARTGRGGMNETPSRTRLNPFVDLLLEVISDNPDIPEGSRVIEGVIAIPAKSERSDEPGQPKRGEPAGICPECGSPLVWRRYPPDGKLYRGCTNYDGGCRYQERSSRRAVKDSKSQEDDDLNGPEPYDVDETLQGPDESHFYSQYAKKNEKTEDK